MSVTKQPSATGEYIIYRRRRNVELVLVLLACSFGMAGWMITHLNLYGRLPAELLPGTGSVSERTSWCGGASPTPIP